MYGGLSFILLVFGINKVMDGRVKVGCDNNKALFLSYKKVQRVRQQKKHADILWAICKVPKSIPLELEFNNICGNQDGRIPARLLDRPS